jgi:hypothetical protein
MNHGKPSRFWDPPHTGRTTIAVLEESEEARSAREQKIKDGAKVVPFGFARALDEEDRR